MIFSINFFLFSFAQSNMSCYLFVFAKYYANVSNAEFGLLAMILPAISLFAKPIACSLTDAHGIHKQFLLCSLAVFGFGYGGLGVIPFLKDREDHSTDFMAWVAIGFLMTCGYTASGCVLSMNDALASNYARKHNLSYGRVRVWASIGWATGALFSIVVGEIPWLPFRVFGCIIIGVCIVADMLLLTLWPYPEDFEMFHDGSTVEQRKLSMVGPNTLALLAQNKPRGSISRDMLEKIRAGRSKSVGNLPRFQTGLNQMGKLEPTKKVVEKKEKEYSNFQCQMILVKMIAKQHKSFLRYIFLFTIFGIIQGMIWTFEFDYFKAKVTKDDAEFEFISAFCMIAQAVFGEILILMIAGQMMKMFGANANLSLALASLGLRCYFYSQILPYVSSMSVVVPEALQGPSLGLYYILIVDIGSNYALMVSDFMPELKRRGIVRDRVHEEELNGCLRASMIGFMSASMEGLGVAVGSFAGGIISGSLGYDYMWNFCAVISIFCAFVNLGWDVSKKLVFYKKPEEKQVDKPTNHLGIPVVVVEDVNLRL